MARIDDPRELRCSFCGKTQSQVQRMIAGPGVCICNECVDLCQSVLDDDEDAPPPSHNSNNNTAARPQAQKRASHPEPQPLHIRKPQEIKEKLDEYKYRRGFGKRY